MIYFAFFSKKVCIIFAGLRKIRTFASAFAHKTGGKRLRKSSLKDLHRQ